MSKKSAEIELDEVNGDLGTNNGFNDAADMRRMGKKQDFQRNFQFLSIAAFSVVAITGWAYVPGTATLALANGGTGGIIIIFLVNWFGLTFVVLTLAEMSSMAPTAGGQYHWASEFAPPSMQKVVSYIAGWFSCVAWLAGTAGAMFLVGAAMQGLIVVNNPSYVPQYWQGWFFTVLVATCGLVINSLLARFLPRLEGVMFLFFTISFMGILVVLWVLSPKLTAQEVFGTIQKGAGWSNLGLSLLASQSAIMFLIVGSDATAHMAEETKNAAAVIPKAMITSYFVNAGTGFVFLVSYCFCLVDYEKTLESPVGLFGMPYIQTFINATGSVGGGSAIVAVLAVLTVFGCANWMASNARQIFAFARDRGLPFGAWIAKVDQAGTYPVNSVIVVWLAVVSLNLITLGSVVAFEAIVSLQILALMFTYLVSLSCIIWRRLFGAPLPSSPWTLGRAALPINIIGWMYCVYMVIFLPWPTEANPPVKYWNWAPIMFAGIMFFSMMYYFIFARKAYKGPVVHVRPRDE